MEIQRVSDLEILTNDIVQSLSVWRAGKYIYKTGDLAYDLGNLSLTIKDPPNVVELSLFNPNFTPNHSGGEIDIQGKQDSLDLATHIWFRVNNIVKENMMDGFFKIIGKELSVTGKIESKKIEALTFLRATTKKGTTFTLKKENEDMNKYVMSLTFKDSNDVSQKINHTFNISNVIQAIAMIISFVRIAIVKYEI